MNPKKLLALPALFIALGLLAQEANLTMKPAAKSKYNVEVTSLVDITQNMGGMEMKVKANSVAKAIMEIEEVTPDGNFTLLSTWKELKAFSSAMGKDTTLNYDNLNIAIRTVYDKSGKIIKTELIDKSSSTDIGVAAIEQFGTSMKLPVLSAKQTQKGEKWEWSTNDTIKTPQSPFAMAVEVTDEFYFAGTETKDGVEYYRINASGPTKVKGEGSQMGMEMSIEGTGTSESYSLHDKKTLFPVFIEGKIGQDMSIMVSGAQSMAIPMTQNTSTTTKFTEIK